MYKDLTTDNRSVIKKFAHNKRFEIALKILKLNSSDKILDYGTGDGLMLQMIKKTNPNCYVAGYEPVKSMFIELSKNSDSENIKLFNQLNDISFQFDKIYCLEVLEHFASKNLRIELNNIKNCLKPNGMVIISVPIEGGISGLLKNIARVLIRQTHEKTTLTNIVRSLFYLPINRVNAKYLHSHIGFYYQTLEKELKSSNFTIIHKSFSPFPKLKGWINSQVFYILRIDSNIET